MSIYDDDEKKEELPLQSLWSIGSNSFGQQMIDSDARKLMELTKVPGIKNEPIQSILSSFAGATYIIYQNGSVSVAGYNEYGQLAIGNYDSKIPILRDWQIKAALISKGICSQHVLIQKEKGSETIYCAGNNSYDQFGARTESKKHNQWIPVVLSNINVKSIAAGYKWSIFLDTNGSIYSCGSSDYGCLGLGANTKSVNTPTKIQTATRMKHIAVGKYHCIAISTNKRAYSWGDNAWGRTGAGQNIKKVYEPTAIPALQHKEITMIDCGVSYSLFLTFDGIVLATGDNQYGQCGVGDKSDERIFIPTRVLIDKAVKWIQCGAYHAVAVTNNNEYYLFGRNNYRQCLIMNDATEKVKTPMKWNIPQKWRFKHIRIIAGWLETRVIVTADELVDFLVNLKLEECIKLLKDQGFTSVEELKDVKREHLDKIGFKLAHTNKILKAIDAHFAAKSEYDIKTAHDVAIHHYPLNEAVKLVSDGLVIFFGVSTYDDSSYANLDDIKEDADYFRNVFKDKFNYRFIANDFSKRWTKSNAEVWMEAIRDNVLTQNDCVVYDCVIFVIASHGTMNAMICSDSQVLDTKYVRSLFAAKVNKKFDQLPKMFIFNFCRDEYKEASGSNIDSGSASYSVTITGSEGRVVFGSNLSKYVANAFSECEGTKNKVIDILSAAYDSAKRDPQSATQLRFQEYDIMINDVAFAKNRSHLVSSGQQTRGRYRTNDTRQFTKTDDLTMFLKEIKLHNLYPAFFSKGFKTKKSLIDIDDKQLKNVGITSDKMRKKILAAIQKK